MPATNHRLLGIALVASGSILWSTAGFFVRYLDLDLWTMQFWRSFFAGLSLLAVILIGRGRRAFGAVRSLGRVGLVAMPLSAVSMYCFVAAIKLTTVANVMMVYATLPFVAAAVAYLWLGERPRPEVLGASAAALLGIMVIVGAAPRVTDVAGNAVALLMTVTFGILLVMARRFPGLDMAPVNALAAFLCALACLPFAGPLPSATELGILAVFGSVTSGFAYLLFLTGGRYIPSSEAGLIGFIDVILGPLWVWLAFGEQPGRALFLGGGLVTAAVVWYLGREIWAGRRAQA